MTFLEKMKISREMLSSNIFIFFLSEKLTKGNVKRSLSRDPKTHEISQDFIPWIQAIMLNQVPYILDQFPVSPSCFTNIAINLDLITPQSSLLPSRILVFDAVETDFSTSQSYPKFV